MTNRATGTFDVTLTPQAPDDGSTAPTIGRMRIDKTFHGDLDGISAGQMLAVGTAVRDSAGYVAMEQVGGTLHGRAGTFVLQHSGSMSRGMPQLKVSVVPDSGTGELEGISGRMEIEIAEGQHAYTFEYELPDRD